MLDYNGHFEVDNKSKYVRGKKMHGKRLMFTISQFLALINYLKNMGTKITRHVFC